MIGFTMVYHTKHHMAFSKHRDFFSVHSMPWTVITNVPQCKKKPCTPKQWIKEGTLWIKIWPLSSFVYDPLKKIKTCRKLWSLSIESFIGHFDVRPPGTGVETSPANGCPSHPLGALRWSWQPSPGTATLEVLKRKRMIEKCVDIYTMYNIYLHIYLYIYMHIWSYLYIIHIRLL